MTHYYPQYCEFTLLILAEKSQGTAGEYVLMLNATINVDDAHLNTHTGSKTEKKVVDSRPASADTVYPGGFCGDL